MLQEIEQEDDKRNNTNYKRILNQVKLRPREIISGKKDTSHLYEFATPFKSKFGHSANLEEILTDLDPIQHHSIIVDD